ncbi:MAG: hypothetical protein A2928_02020 [Candidatus Taylorbacteria bacterium RIFCSPLOWO2_01_FULL_45_15b]|uniref:Uncharacterized protein n=1 Tax=Candidatus Taylorbacteria bacterium RIFCSPLOWO2_01_FULL_45_15b TaxID=1802319 RepID=A0A1G2N6X9_9BACT|nr:MAG: hypothetical protein A2928_02020 [Candidatus Taylorbacteria bacterium RIFCSPLOWO2_01_FULL_45_15b]
MKNLITVVFLIAPWMVYGAEVEAVVGEDTITYRVKEAGGNAVDYTANNELVLTRVQVWKGDSLVYEIEPDNIPRKAGNTLENIAPDWASRARTFSALTNKFKVNVTRRIRAFPKEGEAYQLVGENYSGGKLESYILKVESGKVKVVDAKNMRVRPPRAREFVLASDHGKLVPIMVGTNGQRFIPLRGF